MSGSGGSGNSNRKGPIKPVFSSPGQMESESRSRGRSGSGSSSGSDGSGMDNLMSRHLFPDDVDKSYELMYKEEHEKRLKNLRKELEENLESTAWRYQNIEKLIGQ